MTPRRTSAATFHVDYAIGILPTVFSAAGRLADGIDDVLERGVQYYAFSSDDARAAAAAGVPAGSTTRVNNTRYALGTAALTDYSGREIGHILLLQNVEPLYAALTAQIWATVGSSFIIMVLTLAVVVFIAVRALRPLNVAIAVTAQVADGDLTVRPDTTRADEAGAVLSAMARMVVTLDGTIRAVSDISGDVASGSDSLSAAAAAVSQGASTQAATVEELSAGMEEIESAVRRSAENAQATEEIARNTNLLALNAAIEADRAGERFAKLVPNIQKTAELVQEILHSANEQQSGVSEVTRAIMELDQVVQRNAAHAEELSGTAEQLAGHAQLLRETVSTFVVTAADKS